MNAYLNAPIHRYQGFIGVGLAIGGNVIMYVHAKQLLKKADATIADQQERLKIFHEMTDLLLDRADHATLRELNKSLDFWRVVRGQDVAAPDDI